MKAAVLALAALLGGCASAPRIATLHPEPAAVELNGTPFFPQDEYQCGPAALATVLLASGIDVTPDELVSQVYTPGRSGSLQADIVATTRIRGRVPYPLAASLEDLLAEVSAGQPVLVLQNLGLSFWPAWHYAVVIGYDSASNELILRSGRERAKRESLFRFSRSWKLAQHWALIVSAPDTPPATARPRVWLQAASAFEELGRPQFADAAYRAATVRWPDDPLGWQLLGNARYTLGDLRGAEAAFRSALVAVPDAATYNNLAQVLLERGCPAQARTQIDAALATDAGDSMRVVFERTREQISAYRGPRAKNCAP